MTHRTPHESGRWMGWFLFAATIIMALTGIGITAYNLTSEAPQKPHVAVSAPATITPPSYHPPAPPVAHKASQSGRHVYTVKKGDTLWAISMVHLGEGSDWPILWHLNQIPNPNLIYPGQMLRL